MATDYSVPRTPKAGERLTARWGMALNRAISDLRPVQVPGMLISRGTYGTKYTPLGSSTAYNFPKSSLLPFDVRWMTWDSESDTGEWQIYLPLGCLTVTQGGMTYFYIPLNDRAKDAEGKPVPDWYKIPDPTDTAYANVITEGSRVTTSWTVYLDMKPWPRLRVSTDPTAFDPVYWREAVAEMRVTEYGDDTPTQRAAVRLTNERQMAKTWDISAPFSVRYDIATSDIKNKNAVPTVKLVNQTRFIGRLQVTLTEDTDITNWNDVWIKVLHDGETFETSVEHDLSGAAAASDDDKTVYRIYSLDERVVTQDLRGSVPEMDFYTSPATATATGGGA